MESETLNAIWTQENHKHDPTTTLTVRRRPSETDWGGSHRRAIKEGSKVINHNCLVVALMETFGSQSAQEPKSVSVPNLWFPLIYCSRRTGLSISLRNTGLSWHYVPYTAFRTCETAVDPGLTLVLLNPDMSCLCKQCRSRSVGFFRSQLIWICTICH